MQKKFQIDKLNLVSIHVITCVFVPGGFITTMFGLTCCCIFMPCLTMTNFCGFTVIGVDPVESCRWVTTVGLGVLLGLKKRDRKHSFLANVKFSKKFAYAILGVICWRIWGTGAGLAIGLMTVFNVTVLWGMLVVKFLSLDVEDVGMDGGAFLALKTACWSVTPRKP